MKSTIISTIKFLIGWPLSLVALFFIGKLVLLHGNQVFIPLHLLNVFFLVVSIVAFLIYYFARAYMWKVLLDASGHTISFKESTYLWSISELRRFIPGNIWSIVSKTHLFHEKQVKKTTTLTLIAYEAEFLTLGYLIVSLVSLPIIIQEFLPPTWNKQLFVAITLFLIAGLTLLIIAHKHIFKKTLPILPTFSLFTNLRILTISCISSTIFGLATYITASAVFPLHFWNPFVFIGIFVVSILVGYISFITPMGIGVREAAITFALGRHISISSASFIAIFARIILIVSELIFFGLCFLWAKAYKK